MPRPCAVEIHARRHQEATEFSEMPRPCAVEFHVLCSWSIRWDCAATNVNLHGARPWHQRQFHTLSMPQGRNNNNRSRIVTEGVERAPNRAMLRAVGFEDDDFDKPIVGVANGYSTITPCNMGLNILAERAIAALRRGGTMPQVFGTITVSDGISMGTEGMKYSLVSREVIADSIETVCGAQSVDGLLAVGGCDKNMPGAMIAIARMNIPAIFVYGGTIKAGHYNGQDLTVVSAFEAVGQYSAQRIAASELLEVERHACPGAGSCGGMFTANTMSASIEAMGLSLPFSSTMAAEDAEKADSAARSGEALAQAIHRQLLPRQIL